MRPDVLQNLLGCIEILEVRSASLDLESIKIFLHVAIAGEIPLDELSRKMDLSPEMGAAKVAALGDGRFPGEYGLGLLKPAKLKGDEAVMVRVAPQGSRLVKRLKENLER